MRIIATALAATTLAALPMQAAASTPGAAAPEHTRPETDASPLNDGHAASTSRTGSEASTKKPLEQSAAQTDESVGPKPDKSTQANAREREASHTESS